MWFLRNNAMWEEQLGESVEQSGCWKVLSGQWEQAVLESHLCWACASGGVCCELWELRNHYPTTELREHLWGTISERVVGLFVSITSLWKTRNKRSVSGCSVFIMIKNFKEHLVQHRLKETSIGQEIVWFVESSKCVYVNIQRSVHILN